MTARVVALHHKPRVRGEPGIPKLAVDTLVFDAQGVASDYNHYRTTRLARTDDHGVLLLARETLQSLQTEWPILPGDLGENVLTEGLELVVGARLVCGEALLELTEPCLPCSKLRVLPYVGRERLKGFLQTLTGRRGVYARVLRGGGVRVGDSIDSIATR